jgi:Arc/MetJ family transcription regulator
MLRPRAPCDRYTPGCIDVYMRTNVDIDEELIERAMKTYQVPTKRAVVELALRRLVEGMGREEKLAMEGTGWDGDLRAMREGEASRPPARKGKR